MAYGDGYKTDSKILGWIIVIFLVCSSFGMIVRESNYNTAKEEAKKPDPVVDLSQTALKSEDPQEVAEILSKVNELCKERAVTLKKQADHYSSDYAPVMDQSFNSLQQAQSCAQEIAKHLADLAVAKKN